jgi:hypothetical protein
VTQVNFFEQAIARAEAVPPWRRDQWEDVFETFKQCQVLGGTGEATDIPEDHIRFCFTHQMFNDAGVAHMDVDTINALRARMENDSYDTIMDVYKERHMEWLQKQQTSLEGQTPTENHKVLLKELSRLPLPRFEESKRCIYGMKNLVHVVKTYFCMQSLVVVCSINKTHVPHVNSMAMGWVSVLAKALAQRKTFEARVYRLCPQNHLQAESIGLQAPPFIGCCSLHSSPFLGCCM